MPWLEGGEKGVWEALLAGQPFVCGLKAHSMCHRSSRGLEMRVRLGMCDGCQPSTREAEAALASLSLIMRLCPEEKVVCCPELGGVSIVSWQRAHCAGMNTWL